MSEIIRKLATIEEIKDIKVHPNADKLEIATVRGWDCIVQKDIFKKGDKVVYFEIDSFLPVIPQFEFLRKNCFKSTKHLGEGFRLKTIKLRGVISNGLVLSLSDFNFDQTMMVGTDVTEFLNVVKWEVPIPAHLAGTVKGSFPSFIPKTDEERIQNIEDRDREAHKDDVFEISLKMDGSSMTVYWNEGNFGVCSRNLDLLETEDNTYWKVARKYNFSPESFQFFPYNFVIQGELVGPGIQGNPHKLPEHRLYIFNVYNIDERRYMTPTERKAFMYGLAGFGVVVYHVPVFMLWTGFPSVEKALEMADEATFDGNSVEGLVFKNTTGTFSFKVISNKYSINHE